jgi:hypothetical protein
MAAVNRCLESKYDTALVGPDGFDSCLICRVFARGGGQQTLIFRAAPAQSQHRGAWSSRETECPFGRAPERFPGGRRLRRSRDGQALPATTAAALTLRPFSRKDFALRWQIARLAMLVE